MSEVVQEPEIAEPQVIVTRWWFVRHAPVVDAAQHRLSGQKDVDADLGDTRTLRATAARLPKDAIWLTTHLKRTRQTAEALWDGGAEHIEPVVVRDFAEQAFGAWTGLTWDEVSKLEDKTAARFWDDPANISPPPSQKYSAESFAAVCNRVSLSLEDLTRKHGGRNVVCVAHAGTVRAAVAHALGLTAEQALAIDVKNASLTRLDHITDGLRVKRGGSWRIVGLNMI